MNEDINSLTHRKWRCQYHIVFAPKYRRQIIYGKYKAEIGKILRQICERMDEVTIIEAMGEYVLSKPPRYFVRSLRSLRS